MFGLLEGFGPDSPLSHIFGWGIASLITIILDLIEVLQTKLVSLSKISG